MTDSAQRLELAPCPFCGSEIKHVESWARSFDPPRLYHEWHHVADNEDICPARRHIGKIVAAATDNIGEQKRVIDRWNTRAALRSSALPETGERIACHDHPTRRCTPGDCCKRDSGAPQPRGESAYINATQPVDSPNTSRPSPDGAVREALERDIFAEITAKAIPVCDPQSDDPERVRHYIVPVGPIHRAAGKLNFQMFDGERHLAEAVAEIRALKHALASNYADHALARPQEGAEVVSRPMLSPTEKTDGSQS
jgi:hypothetical protein